MSHAPLQIDSPTALLAVSGFGTHAQRTATLLGGLLLVLTLSACDAADRTTAPAAAITARVATESPKSLADAFVDAQGTYCDAATPGDCELAELYGVGYYSVWCGAGCPLGIGADFAGMNAKWWARNGLPAFPSYYYTGAVSESRLADGRRRIIANIRGYNTFVLLATAPGNENMVLGADFFEYPIISPAARVPVLGDAAIATELIVPADFIGMPDISELLFFPSEGMEIRRMDITVTTRGALRQAYDGIAAGTIVDARGTFRYMPKLGVVGVKSRRLIELGYDPTSRVTVKAAPRQ